MLKLRSIDMKRQDGVFRDEDGLIPEGKIVLYCVIKKSVSKFCY
jgi:hypothetical protein